MVRGRELLLKVLALTMGVAALLLVGFYAWSVHTVIDAPDQSLIFWYSPFLLFGLFLFRVAIVFAALARIMRREEASPGRRESGRSDDGTA